MSKFVLLIIAVVATVLIIIGMGDTIMYLKDSFYTEAFNPPAKHYLLVFGLSLALTAIVITIAKIAKKSFEADMKAIFGSAKIFFALTFIISGALFVVITIDAGRVGLIKASFMSTCLFSASLVVFFVVVAAFLGQRKIVITN